MSSEKDGANRTKKNGKKKKNPVKEGEKTIDDSRFKYPSSSKSTIPRTSNAILTHPPYSLFFGKTKVMSKALGSDPSSEYQTNTSLLSPHLVGNVGLLFTNREPSSIITFFQELSKTDFARAGTEASRNFTIPAGIVYSMGGEIAPENDVPMSHSLEPELRRLNVPTTLTKGKITLENPYCVCNEGEVLDSRQTRLLKLFGVATAEFTVQLLA